MSNLLSTTKSVSQLVCDFEAGIIAIPEIQRDVVWKSEQIKDLIDSINRGYPCGSLILWEPREKDAHLVKTMIRPERQKLFTALPKYFLLDGQQRLTALASIILDREKLKSILIEIEEELPFIYVNTNTTKHSYEFEATTDLGVYKFPWILFNKLFEIGNNADLKKMDAIMLKKMQSYIQNIRDYIFPVQIIQDREYQDVGEIFTRVNSMGTQLTGAEIHLANIVPHWRGITKEFREYRKEVRGNNYDIDLTFLIRALAVVECKTPQIKKLAERISKDRPSLNHLNSTWRRTKGATNKLISLLQKEFLLDKSKYITSKNTLIPLVYYLAENKGKPAKSNIKQFFLYSQLSEHYGGSVESTFRKDFRVLAEPSVTPRQGLAELVNLLNREVRQYYRGLKIKQDDIIGLPMKNVLVLFMYILMRNRNATDWGSGRVKRLHEIVPNQTQLHHIYPFNYMVKNKTAYKAFEDEGYTEAKYRTVINDIANMTFLSQSKNVEIGDKPPWQYLPNDTTKEMRKAHFIPENPHLWKPENYMGFLKERRRLLAKAMNGLLKYL